MVDSRSAIDHNGVMRSLAWSGLALCNLGALAWRRDRALSNLERMETYGTKTGWARQARILCDFGRGWHICLCHHWLAVVQMKRILLLCLAAIFAFAGSELIVFHAIGYPPYGVEMKIMGIRGSDQAVNIFKPYSKYWTVEGGNRVFKRNNIGLTGIDVWLAKDAKFVFVLGTSYVQASHLPPEQIAVSVFQEKLRSYSPEFQALNLGMPVHDPYDSYWRANYFEKKYYPAKVFLVIESPYADWFRRQCHPLNFDAGKKKIRRLRSQPLEIARYIMNHSSFCNLTFNLLKTNDRAENENASGNFSVAEPKKTGPELFECIFNFKRKYGNRFILISIAKDGPFNAKIMSFCKTNGIDFCARNLLLPGNRINGHGHLNAVGNRLLGELLYETFVKF